MYNDVARYTGEALDLHTCMQQGRTTYQKPVLIGFADLHQVNNDNKNKIREQSHSIAPITHQQVRCRSLGRVHRQPYLVDRCF